MPYTVEENKLTMTFRDIADRTRGRSIEISGGNIITDDDIEHMNDLSNSAVRSYWEQQKQVDMSKAPNTESEVQDTARLYFLMPNDTVASFDLVDPHIDLFQALVGKNSLSIRNYVDLNILNVAEAALKWLIDDILGGRILISDGETPHSYLNGKKL